MGENINNPSWPWKDIKFAMISAFNLKTIAQGNFVYSHSLYLFQVLLQASRESQSCHYVDHEVMHFQHLTTVRIYDHLAIFCVEFMMYQFVQDY